MTKVLSARFNSSSVARTRPTLCVTEVIREDEDYVRLPPLRIPTVSRKDQKRYEQRYPFHIHPRVTVSSRFRRVRASAVHAPRSFTSPSPAPATDSALRSPASKRARCD